MYHIVYTMQCVPYHRQYYSWQALSLRCRWYVTIANFIEISSCPTNSEPPATEVQDPFKIARPIALPDSQCQHRLSCTPHHLVTCQTLFTTCFVSVLRLVCQQSPRNNQLLATFHLCVPTKFRIHTLCTRPICLSRETMPLFHTMPIGNTVTKVVESIISSN